MNCCDEGRVIAFNSLFYLSLIPGFLLEELCDCPNGVTQIIAFSPFLYISAAVITLSGYFCDDHDFPKVNRNDCVFRSRLCSIPARIVQPRPGRSVQCSVVSIDADSGYLRVTDAAVSKSQGIVTICKVVNLI